ncbi:hypothetical protein AQUCO_00700039v1 [Aquilegia coerulea]|uniref:Choline transporter-like protein n=1 Tax=Aquilegia coerulea TaxID=218851 RepID=A0A2G5EIQ5_AQUCA|nr:hypothetical protein AQUCO_00700039v1 [Aquilegia coerulea]
MGLILAQLFTTSNTNIDHEPSSSSPSHPLLSKPYPSSSSPPPSSIQDDSIVDHIITYNYNPRHFQDIPFLILFLLFILSTFSFGIFAIVHHNPNASNWHLHLHLCRRRGGIIGPFVLGLLWLLRHYTKQIVYGLLPFFILIPAFINVYWFVACTLSSNCSDVFPLVYRIIVLVFVFLIIGVIVWILVANWNRIELTFDTALLVYFVPIVVFLVFARLNGKIVPHLSKGSESVYSCGWKQDSWVPAYYALAILTMLWSAAAMVEAQLFVISGTIAQWYFSKEGSRPNRSIRSSLRNAFGPSFGTICFSGLLICVTRVVRTAVDTARREDVTSGIVNIILRCCVNALLSAIDFLNKFTINFVAITGEGYCSAAKMTYELLKRNLLSAVFVETVSTRILGGIIFVLSAVYAIAACAILKAVSNLGVDAYFVAVLAWLLLIVVLGFFVHVLDNVIDTVYVCFAIDRDKGEVCKQEVHEVYVYLPISRNHRASVAVRTPLLV